MRPRILPSTPRELSGAESAGGRELSNAQVYYGLAEGSRRRTGGASFKFKAYALPQVRQALGQAFGGKCAYCESPVRAVAPIDVEHYRPKGGVEAWKGEDPIPRRSAPLYFWLAASWDNLLPSCLSCNRVSWQTLADGSRKKTGKGNFFPLAAGSVRPAVGQAPTGERPLLLNPYLDAPDEHLRFLRDGTVEPARRGGIASERGVTTIELLGLNREPLVHGRRRVIAIALRSVDNIQKFQRKAAERPGDPWFEWQIASEVTVLEQHLQLDAPYSMAVAQVLGLSR